MNRIGIVLALSLVLFISATGSSQKLEQRAGEIIGCRVTRETANALSVIYCPTPDLELKTETTTLYIPDSHWPGVWQTTVRREGAVVFVMRKADGHLKAIPNQNCHEDVGDDLRRWERETTCTAKL